MIDLQYIAMRMAFGKVDADEIQSTVDTLLKDGVYSDNFIDIIDSKPARLADVLPLFREYLESEGISVPSQEDGVWQIIAYHLSRIASGQVDPLSELEILISEVYWDYDFHSVTTKYIGDSHGIEQLVGFYWGYDDMQDRLEDLSCNGKHGEAGVREMKKEIVKCSEEWMKRFANKALHCTTESRANAASSVQ